MAPLKNPQGANGSSDAERKPPVAGTAMGRVSAQRQSARAPIGHGATSSRDGRLSDLSSGSGWPLVPRRELSEGVLAPRLP